MAWDTTHGTKVTLGPERCQSPRTSVRPRPCAAARALVGSTLFGVMAILPSLSCAPEADRLSEVRSLRVLAVKKDKPYAKPGDCVTMTMLSHDPTTQGAAEEVPRPVQKLWLGGCFNPPGDLYYGCFSDPSFGQSLLGLATPGGEQQGQGPDPACPTQDPQPAPIGLGDRFTLKIPEAGALKEPATAGQPPFGTAFVFFAACTGELGPAEPTGKAEVAFPLACRDGNGNALGPDDFVAGYATVFIYQDIANQNPVIEGFEFDGRRYLPGETAATCVGEACVGREPCLEQGEECDKPTDCCSGRCRDGVCAGADELTCDRDVPCVERCDKKREEDCRSFEIGPLVSRKPTVEMDELANTRGRAFKEQIWVNYHTTGGTVASEVRLVNDAVAGFIPDYQTELRLPNDTPEGEDLLTLWAVVRDNRGGTEWVRQLVRLR